MRPAHAHARQPVDPPTHDPPVREVPAEAAAVERDEKGKGREVRSEREKIREELKEREYREKVKRDKKEEEESLAALMSGRRSWRMGRDNERLDETTFE